MFLCECVEKSVYIYIYRERERAREEATIFTLKTFRQNAVEQKATLTVSSRIVLFSQLLLISNKQLPFPSFFWIPSKFIPGSNLLVWPFISFMDQGIWYATKFRERPRGSLGVTGSRRRWPVFLLIFLVSFLVFVWGYMLALFQNVHWFIFLRKFTSFRWLSLRNPTTKCVPVKPCFGLFFVSFSFHRMPSLQTHPVSSRGENSRREERTCLKALRKRGGIPSENQRRWSALEKVIST